MPTPEGHLSLPGSDCTAYRDDLEAFVDGALDDHRRHRLVKHLQACTNCAADEEELQELSEALSQTLPPLSCPPELAASLLTIAETPPSVSGRIDAATPNLGIRPLGDFGLARGLRAKGQGLRRPAVSLARPWRHLLAAASLVLAVGLTQALRVNNVTEIAVPADASLEQAAAEAELALAYIGRVGRRIGETVRADLLEAPPLRRTLGTTVSAPTTVIEFEDRDHEPR